LFCPSPLHVNTSQRLTAGGEGGGGGVEGADDDDRTRNASLLVVREEEEAPKAPTTTTEPHEAHELMIIYHTETRRHTGPTKTGKPRAAAEAPLLVRGIALSTNIKKAIFGPNNGHSKAITP
jgi:hypothetical protein